MVFTWLLKKDMYYFLKKRSERNFRTSTSSTFTSSEPTWVNKCLRLGSCPGIISPHSEWEALWLCPDGSPAPQLPVSPFLGVPPGGPTLLSLPPSPPRNSPTPGPSPRHNVQAVTLPSAVLPVVEGGCDNSHQHQLRFNKSTLPGLCENQDMGRHHRGSCPSAAPLE